MKKNSSIVKIPRIFSALFVVFITVICGAFLVAQPKKFNKIDAYFLSHTKKLKNELSAFQWLCHKKTAPADIKKQFLQTRIAYKQLAVLTDFFNPYETKFLNGPALERIEEDNPDNILAPHGFQVVEGYLYEWTDSSYRLLDRELDYIATLVNKMENEEGREQKFRDPLVFEALRSSVIRLMSLGITGFDSPLAQLSLPEARASLEGMDSLISLYAQEARQKDVASFQQTEDLLHGASAYLNSYTDFNAFDRLYFIKNFADPLYRAIGRVRAALNLPLPEGRRPVKATTPSVFSADAFDINFFSPDEQYQVTKERVRLGKKLFFDPVLSQTRTRSCASCHKPALAFTDGLALPSAIDGKTILTRNTPTLWNSVLQTRQFYDSRVDMLENQLDEVVHNAQEMKGSLKQSVNDLKQDALYDSLFRKAYPAERQPLSAYTIANAISSYVRSLVALNSKFDRYIRGEENNFTDSEKNGFNLFAGKAKCATCHFIPLFNGLVPPEFNETESEVLGVPGRGSKKTLDPDLGKYNFTSSRIHRHAFKIPTLRNIALTAPYMHNGVFKTLDEVIWFYNKGGGKGLGIAPPNQTLPFDRLQLSGREMKDLEAFLHTLNDTTAHNN